MINEMLDDLLRLEGGYVNHPNDKGGPTNYGVTQKVLSKFLKRPATETDVKNLDRELAKEIYKAEYFYGPRIHTLPEALQPQLFDMSVNHGPRKAVTILQSVLNLAGFECGKDGVVGPATRKLAEQAYEQMGGLLINAISEAREEFYRAIVASDRSQGVFLKGWLKRAREFRVDV